MILPSKIKNVPNDQIENIIKPIIVKNNSSNHINRIKSSSVSYFFNPYFSQ
jgi:hypothetical protein